MTAAMDQRFQMTEEDMAMMSRVDEERFSKMESRFEQIQRQFAQLGGLGAPSTSKEISQTHFVIDRSK